jgi:hypothetical protein
VEKEFSRPFIVMDAEVERALASNSDFLRDVIATVGEGKAGAHEACPLSNPWLRLVADSRKFCSILPRSASVNA